MSVSRLRTIGLTLCCLSLTMVSTSFAAEESPEKPESKAKRLPTITNPKFDPSAERVEFFEGVERGDLEFSVRANGPMGGHVFIENKTDKPLTVELPDAVVGVQVLEQFGGMGGGMGGMGMGGMGGMGMGGMGGMGMGGMGGGMGQSFGGGMGGMGGMGMGGMGGGMGGMGGGMGGMGGGGFFSIPPERKVRVPYHSVCLNHGKTDPHPRMNYTLVKVEQYTADPTLQEVIRMVGTGKLEPGVAQAAAWHITDGMSWQELAAKTLSHGPVTKSYFNLRQLRGAQSVVATAAGRARERGDDPAPATPRASIGTQASVAK